MTQDPYITLEVLVRRLGAIPEREMRRAEIRRWVLFGDADEVVRQLEQMVSLCMQRLEDALLAQLAFADFLLHADDTDGLALEALDISAQREELRASSFLLSDHPPFRRVDGAIRNLSLKQHIPAGVRRWRARQSDRAMLEVLLADPDPRVVNRLCANPRITEDDIVAISAKRPNRSDVLDEVARSRWLSSEAVRRALIQNPYARTNLAISLLPAMGTRFLAALRHSHQVHEAVRDAAQCFLELVPGWTEEQ